MKKDYKNVALRPPVNNRLLREITRRIVANVKPQKIILFGSYAYGKPNKDSDLDLFVVKNTSLPASERFGLISDVLYPRLIPMDFIVKTPHEVKERLNCFDPFIKEIFAYGKILYEKK